MFLRPRGCSTQTLCSIKWFSNSTVKSSKDASSCKTTPEDTFISPNVQQLHRHQNMSARAVSESLKLHSMISERKAPAQIFQHISENSNHKLSPGLVETYLFGLLDANNLNAAVSLVHILLLSDVQHYKLSNQFWSLLASKASSSGHHAAASLVYHEIVNPSVNFLGEKLSEENEHIPFLLLPTAIEGLAIVFAQNGNHIAVEGLRLYFKRFYSNFGHRDVYQTLYISKVESLAVAGLFSESLSAFVALALRYRGHLHPRNSKDAFHSLKYASNKHYKKRERNISQNIHIEENAGADFEKENKLFAPEIKFNTYTFDNGPYWAILDDVLTVGDLPNFRSRLREKIQQLLSHSDSVVDRLLAFITKNHFTMTKFVVTCLCDLGYCFEAVAVANKIPSLSKGIRRDACLSSYEFSHIFRALAIKFENKTFETSRDAHKLLMDSYKLYHGLDRQTTVTDACFRSFIRCYLHSPMATSDELTQLVKSWNSQTRNIISLEKDAYDSAVSLGLDPRDLREITNVHS